MPRYYDAKLDGTRALKAIRDVEKQRELKETVGQSYNDNGLK